MTLVSTLLGVLLLLAANALYVAAEFGIVSVRRSRLRTLAEDGSNIARGLLPIVENPAALDRYIAACQIGITVSSLVLGAYGQAELAPLLVPVFAGLGGWEVAAANSVAAIVVLVVLTISQMLLGELVPKGIALQFPDRTSLATAVPMRLSLRLLRPLIWLFNGSGLAVLSLLGLRHSHHRHVHSPGEIESLIVENTTVGELDAEERRRLRRALHLSSRRARDLMVPRDQVIAIDIDQPFEEVATAVAAAPYSRFPVYRGTLDRPVGTLHARDLAVAQIRCEAGQTETPALGDLVTRYVTVEPGAPADSVLGRMRAKRVQQALVIEASGRVAGLVTMTDVLAEVLGAMAAHFRRGRAAAERRP